MLENTNKTIAINSTILYLKLFVTTFCTLFTTRFALTALGVDDFGLFSVLGSVISFIGLFNTVMLSSTNRFLSIAIGKGDNAETNKIFNVNLTIFLLSALIIMSIAYPVGKWYICRYINYNGNMDNAIMVLCITMLGSVVSAVGTPYNGLLIARERFAVFCIVDILLSIFKLISTYLLVFFFSQKLLIYTLIISFTTGIPTFIYLLYSHKYFKEITKWRIIKDLLLYKQIFKFSGWVAYGAISFIAKAQGAALLVNVFFNTVMNTALGLANIIISFVTLFAQNITQPMQPQITKSYAKGDLARTTELLVMSTRFSFLFMLLIASPFFVACEWIINLWLGNVPPYVVSFTKLLIVDNLIMSFNSGLSVLIFACGRIAIYQLVISTLRILSIIVAFFLLRAGSAPEGLLFSYIFFSLIIVLATQIIVSRYLKFNISILYKKSYIPSLLVFLLFLPVLFLPDSVIPLGKIILSAVYLMLLEAIIGLSKKERIYLFNILKNIKSIK